MKQKTQNLIFTQKGTRETTNIEQSPIHENCTREEQQQKNMNFSYLYYETI